MKSLIIKNDEIDYELFEKIASFLDKYDENEVLAIWLSSRGGVCSVTEAIRDLLESDERVVLIAYDMISSSALDLFLSTNSANAASRHIMIGIPELKYKEVLCGLLYLRYSPYIPLHPLLLSPSHIKPKF